MTNVATPDLGAQMTRLIALGLTLTAGLAGCANVPELDAKITPAARTAPYPTLQELGPVIAASQEVETDAETAEILRARAARLQARANALR